MNVPACFPTLLAALGLPVFQFFLNLMSNQFLLQLPFTGMQDTWVSLHLISFVCFVLSFVICITFVNYQFISHLAVFLPCGLPAYMLKWFSSSCHLFGLFLRYHLRGEAARNAEDVSKETSVVWEPCLCVRFAAYRCTHLWVTCIVPIWVSVHNLSECRQSYL